MPQQMCEKIWTLPSQDFPSQRHELQKQEKLTGGDPLSDPDKETVAQFLACPRDLREHPSQNKLAEHIGKSRMTVYRWSREPAVQTRAEWLLFSEKQAGRITVRSRWNAIVEAQISAALGGNTQAARFCGEQAWVSEKEEHLPEKPDLAIGAMLAGTEAPEIIEVPEWFEGEVLTEEQNSEFNRTNCTSGARLGDLPYSQR